MTVNRRNHYRLLHVQPDAPIEVIRAAYRALMAVHHPDAGGDAYQAMLLNDAYAVLSDPAKRAAFDAHRALRATARQRPLSVAPAELVAPPARACPMCHLGLPVRIGRDTRCTRCRAPLAPALAPDARVMPLDRRSVPRVSKADWAIMHGDWQAEGVDVRLRDLSLDGISLYSGVELPRQRVVRVISASFDVVAIVVACRRVDRVFTVHAQLLTALFAKSTGGVVSTMA
jgi:hypothetical protein